MSRQDPGAATGQGAYPPIGRCTCAHLETLHALPAPGRRGACSASTCACRTYTEDGEA